MRAITALVCALAVIASASQKKKKEEETQTLQLPRELPAAVVGDTRRLNFFVTPLSAKGLLSQQIKDALKALSREAGSQPVLQIRAFVAGSGDMRRVRDLVSEFYTDHRQALPALSLVQTGGLPMEGAQVVLEAVAAGKKEVSQYGAVFLSAPVASAEGPTSPIEPLTVKVLADLREAVKAAGSEPADVARVTCFFSSLDNLAASRRLVEAEYPRAALDYVQTMRAPERALAACEAVARLRRNTGTRVLLKDSVDGQSKVALVSTPHVVLTGTQVSFGYQEQDSRLAFGRLQKVLEQAGAGMRDVAYVHYYPLSLGIASQVRKLRSEFFDAGQPPAGTLLLFEGLPSMDAGFALDVIAAKD